MPVYVDVSAAVHAKAGIGRYAGSLARALVALAPNRFAVFYNRHGDVRPPTGLEAVPRSTIRAGYKPWRMAVWAGNLAHVSFRRLIPGAELFHATEHLLPPFEGVPTVLTVHDMIFRLFPEHQKRLNYWYLNATMPTYCRRADAIITVSQTSKQDILRNYRLNPDKIAVVYEAASREFSPSDAAESEQARIKYGLPERYLIHVGTIEPRKNLTRLVEALDLLRSQGTAIPLVVVGSKGWLYDDFFRRLSQLEIRDLVLLPGYVPARDLPMLYSAATAAVVPSLYEGFGLPVLEAMACGTPVICSTASCLPEIAGEAAHYFQPTDIGEMASAIRSVWTDGSLRDELSTRGIERASAFSWERAAAETIAVYNRILGAGAVA